MARTESHQRAIDQVAILWPYLTIAERMDWWKRLNCPLVELSINMPTFEERVAEARSRKGGIPQ